MDRRDMLKFAAGLSISPFLRSLELKSLKQLSLSKGIGFGTAVGPEIFRNAKYKELILKHCSILTPENQLKWKQIVSGRGIYDFHGADRLYDLCTENSLQMRGHALIFEKSMRSWLMSCECNLERELNKYIRTIVGRYTNVTSWDLFNEIVDPDGHRDWLRKDVLFNKLGSDYLKIYSQLMRQLTPGSELVLNEWIGPYKNRYFRNRRSAVLKALDFIRENDIAIDTLGVQSHLRFSSEDYDRKDWMAFCHECRDLGYELKITELDLAHNSNVNGSNKIREIRKISSDLRAYIEDTLSFSNVNSVVCWGLNDSYAYSMSNKSWKLLPFGATPFEADYKLGLLGTELYSALRDAPMYAGVE